MSTLFISDLHLDASQPQITKTFFYFLEHIASTADTLYILGDFFEMTIGDDDDNAFTQSIIRALSRLTASGVPVFLMHGNRDFLMGKAFAQRAGITFIPDPTIIELANQKILLMHGDSLCTEDKSHQRFRKIVHNSIVQKLFLSLPLSFRRKIANQMRKRSIQTNSTKSASIMDVTESAVDAAIKKYHASKLIHGHTHKPNLGEKRIVLDAWHDHGNYLIIDQNGKAELINIPH